MHVFFFTLVPRWSRRLHHHHHHYRRHRPLLSVVYYYCIYLAGVCTIATTTPIVTDDWFSSVCVCDSDDFTHTHKCTGMYYYYYILYSVESEEQRDTVVQRGAERRRRRRHGRTGMRSSGRATGACSRFMFLLQSAAVGEKKKRRSTRTTATPAPGQSVNSLVPVRVFAACVCVTYVNFLYSSVRSCSASTFRTRCVAECARVRFLCDKSSVLHCGRARVKYTIECSAVRSVRASDAFIDRIL